MPVMIEDYVGLRVTVMGLGRFGGGVGVTRFLAERGVDVLVTDKLPAEELKDSVAQLADLEKRGGVHFRLGEHNVSDFTTCDLLVVSPAVKPDNRFVRAARAAGIPITSEIRLLVKHLPNRLRTIGITGSAGKSTTTAMTAHILRKVLGQAGETPLIPEDESTPRRQDAKTPRRSLAGPGVWMGGNIGGSLLPWIEEIRDDDWVVLELSSFMLEGLREDQWSPHIAVVTNISPNHLDWHGSMENYVAAKESIFLHQDREADLRVLGPNTDRPFNEKWGEGFPKIWYPHLGQTQFDIAESIRVPGRHNCVNAILAHCASAGSIEKVKESVGSLEDFSGLPHRLEFIGDYSGFSAYNDSKSTTPEAAKLAIESFDAGSVRIILGGYDKGSDLGELVAIGAERCAGVYTIGATGDGIADLVQDAMRAAPGNARTPKAVVERCGTLEVAVGRALKDVNAGEVLVLSPGCASWDQFANYEERGARFVELVRGYGAG